MIKFIDVTKVFPNGYVGLEEITFAIAPQALTYITGESGAGKTTLMRLMLRELNPTAGEIWLGEENILQLPSSKIPYHRRRLGVVFQDYRLIPEKTVTENVSLILEIAGHLKNQEIQEQVSEVLELVGLADKQDLFPIQLSGGEMQRAAIARALVTAPQVMFADEPTGNLDAQTSHGIMELLKKIQDLGTTVIVATHDDQIMKDFPARKIALQKGKIIDDSDPIEVTVTIADPVEDLPIEVSTVDEIQDDPGVDGADVLEHLAQADQKSKSKSKSKSKKTRKKHESL